MILYNLSPSLHRSPPPPLRFTDQLPTDYISEPEVEERARRYASYRARPASALPDSGRPLQYTSNNSPAPLAGANKSQGKQESNPVNFNPSCQTRSDEFSSLRDLLRSLL